MQNTGFLNKLESINKKELLELLKTFENSKLINLDQSLPNCTNILISNHLEQVSWKNKHQISFRLQNVRF